MKTFIRTFTFQLHTVLKCKNIYIDMYHNFLNIDSPQSKAYFIISVIVQTYSFAWDNK